MLKLGEGALGWSTQVTRWPALGHKIHTKLHNNTLRHQTITLHYAQHYHSLHATLSFTTYYTIIHYVLH